MIAGLAERLQNARLNVNFSRKQVANLIGVSDSIIGLYESGSRQPSLSVLVKLSAIYKVSTDYLLGCETTDKKYISVEGLSEQQIKALKLTVSCFRQNL